MGIARLLEGLAINTCAAGEMEAAATLWGQAAQVRALANCPDTSRTHTILEHSMEAAWQALGSAGYEAAFQAGNQISYEAILDHLRARITYGGLGWNA